MTRRLILNCNHNKCASKWKSIEIIQLKVWFNSRNQKGFQCVGSVCTEWKVHATKQINHHTTTTTTTKAIATNVCVFTSIKFTIFTNEFNIIYFEIKCYAVYRIEFNTTTTTTTIIIVITEFDNGKNIQYNIVTNWNLIWSKWKLKNGDEPKKKTRLSIQNIERKKYIQNREKKVLTIITTVRETNEIPIDTRINRVHSESTQWFLYIVRVNSDCICTHRHTCRVLCIYKELKDTSPPPKSKREFCCHVNYFDNFFFW